MRHSDGGKLLYTLVIVSVAAGGGLLFGYDTAVISGAIGFLGRHFVLSAAGTGWAVSCTLIGCILGVIVAGGLIDRLGRKKIMILSAVFFMVSAVGTALAGNFTTFILFRMIGGLGVGAASMTSPMYIAEVSPKHMRGGLVSLNQLAIVGGMLIVYFVNYVIADSADDVWNVTLGWRWMMGSGGVPSLVFLLLLFFVPESPRWLTKEGLDSEALVILTRIGGIAHARGELAEIRASLVQEVGSFREIFLPGMRTAMMIGLVLAVFQQVSGITVICYYAPEIFKTMGSQTDSALLQTVIMGAVNMGFTVVAIATVDRMGRKPLMLLGTAGMGFSLLAFGTSSYFQQAGLWPLIIILVYIASFALSVGPVTWVILSEIFPTKFRGRAMGMATVFLWIAAFTVSQTFPLIDNNPWLVERFHHAFSFWLYGALCALSLIFIGFFIPETKGKSLEDIERFWLPVVSAFERETQATTRTRKD